MSNHNVYFQEEKGKYQNLFAEKVPYPELCFVFIYLFVCFFFSEDFTVFMLSQGKHTKIPDQTVFLHRLI